MAFGGAVVGMRLAGRVEVSAGTHAVARRAIAFVVYVETVLGARLEALYVGHNAHLVAHLRKGHRAAGVIAFGRFEIGDRNGAFGRHAGTPREQRYDECCDREVVGALSSSYFFAGAAAGLAAAGVGAAAIATGFGMGLPALRMLDWKLVTALSS